MPPVAETPSTHEAEALRKVHQVRLVAPDEQGFGADALPAGVYGFTYSPGLPNAPLFAERRYRSYETHKVAAEVYVIGFATPEDAERLATAAADITIKVRPQPEEACTTLVKVPYSRIRRHRQYAAPNQEGLTVTLAP